MCGICGIVSGRSGEHPDPDLVRRAGDAIRHRGPDHGAVQALGSCVLGYRRLRVIDLATGDQPVTNETAAIVAVFNGEIYNFRELRADLESRGHLLTGTGDTPILPHLYEEYGDRFVERLDGMFALALWDRNRERLLLARDRFGKKPLLYVHASDGTVAFASELKALLTFPGISRHVDLARLDAYLALGYVPGEATAIEQVRRVPPGSVLAVEGGQVRVQRYWSPEPARLDLDEEEWVEAVRTGVRDAVRKRLIADVPLGALLSGGVDSSVVVAAMAEESRDAVRTFSVGFRDELYDERPYARAVAERFGTVHEELLVEPDATALLPRLADAYDEPFGDPSALPTFLVCEHARRFVTVALTGDGGDEVFGGYERYRAHALAGRMGFVPDPIPRAAAQMLRLLPSARTEPRSRAFRAARFLETAGLDTAERYGRLMEVSSPGLRRRLYTDEALAAIGTPKSAGELLGRPQAGITGLQLLDASTYLPDDLLYKADIASMAHSLELRSPLLDHRLAELALGLPDRLKLRGSTGKVALRRAFADVLPPRIVSRGKRGFGVPVGRWFRDDLRELAGDLLLDGRATGRGLFRRDALEGLLADHIAARADHGARLWSLVMLELWHREYVDGEPVVPLAAAAR